MLIQRPPFIQLCMCQASSCPTTLHCEAIARKKMRANIYPPAARGWRGGPGLKTCVLEAQNTFLSKSVEKHGYSEP